MSYLDIYQRLPGLVLGFHGCDAEWGQRVLDRADVHLRPSTNNYDWLGGGIYFWENDPQRAYEFAAAAATNPRLSKGSIKTPFVIGAVIDLGFCCNLLDRRALDEIKESHAFLEAVGHVGDGVGPTNGKDRLTRRLDCLVIENMHKMRRAQNIADYDTVRGAIWEGGALYPGAAIEALNHVQIAVRNPDCIKGYFRPRTA